MCCSKLHLIKLDMIKIEKLTAVLKIIYINFWISRFFFSFRLLLSSCRCWVWNKVATVAFDIRLEYKNIVDVYLHWKNERVWTKTKKYFPKNSAMMMMKEKEIDLDFYYWLYSIECARWILLNPICKYKLIHRKYIFCKHTAAYWFSLFIQNRFVFIVFVSFNKRITRMQVAAHLFGMLSSKNFCVYNSHA